MFLITHRWPSSTAGKKEILSVVWANLAIIALATGLSLLIGFWNYVLIQLPLIWLAGMAGIWMFYIQHQYETVYWAREKDWNYVASAIFGASYYKLPGIFQWFSGNIGFHHIHHLAPKVPNYLLEPAYRSTDLLQRPPIINIKRSLDCVRLRLYDEQHQKMVEL